MENEFLKRLLKQYLTGNITDKGKSELAQLLKVPESRKQLELLMEETFKQDTFLVEENLQMRDEIQNWLKEKLVGSEETETLIHQFVPNKRVIPLLWKYVAAALIVIVAGVGIFTLTNKREHKPLTVQLQNKTNDVLPGKFKAKLTLADGSVVVLDSANNKLLAKQGSTNVINEDGRVVYKQKGKEQQILYNTLSTTTGETYSMVLSDGTTVWLNTKSSVRFPVVFVGKQREVEVSGEVYFEVARNKEQPFIVKVNNAEVQVLGTHFNIMSYDEESTVNTTLFEGSVKFVVGASSVMLKPGQQSQMAKNGEMKVISDVDLDKVIAWKNGLFVFDGADLETVMRQLSRWYGVDIMYKAKALSQSFIGEIPRNSNLSDVLKVLELTSKIRFEIQGKKIIVN